MSAGQWWQKLIIDMIATNVHTIYHILSTGLDETSARTWANAAHLGHNIDRRLMHVEDTHFVSSVPPRRIISVHQAIMLTLHIVPNIPPLCAMPVNMDACSRTRM